MQLFYAFSTHFQLYPCSFGLFPFEMEVDCTGVKIGFNNILWRPGPTKPM